MNCNGYDMKELHNGIEITGVRDFNPIHTFECGQCFRWHKEADGSFTGVVREKAVNISYYPDELCLVIRNSSLEDFKNIWFDYFDLGRDYGVIKKAVAIDDIMQRAVSFGSGIRLLRQEPWEALISFILSSNNRIPRIMKIIEKLSEMYGNELEYDGKKYYGFPTAANLAAGSPEQIQECRAGYRCRYISQTAASVASGEFDLQELKLLDTPEAKKYLMQLSGVGGKVADCVLLYSGTKQDVFPADVWVKRVMQELYFRREASIHEIHQFASDKFGEFSGIAQQYLFYYAREQKIGI